MSNYKTIIFLNLYTNKIADNVTKLGDEKLMAELFNCPVMINVTSFETETSNIY